MADYKRMVSYMYQYDDGVKKKNVGFARVEAKNEQCKITLHMQLLGQTDSIFPTYLIQRDEKDMELIYLGDAVLKNHVMDSKLAANEVNIADSGYGLSDMGGLLIFLNDNVFFATEWDDKPIVAKEVLEALKPKPKKKISSKDKEIVNSNEELQVAKTESLEDNFEKASNEEAGIPKYKLPRGWKTVERLQKPPSAVASNSIENTLEAADMRVEMKVNLEEYEGAGDISKEKQNIDGYNSKRNDEELTSSDKGEMSPSEEVDLPDHATARHFFENYPKIYPFEDNEIMLCVKIEPKDIGSMPKEIWGLSNNSFLMHGFYCYHHLIFAKMRDRYGFQYVIGVPGIYHNRERFMAKMFGFESFKSIKKRELRQGDFGYWYVPIAL